MTDLDLLLRAVITHPDEDTPRLAYADAVQEASDEARAEFIRVQIAGGLRPIRLTWMIPFEPFFGCQPHQLGYVAAAGEAWAHQTGTNRRVVFRRGFAESVVSDAANFLQMADHLIWHPEQTVECPKCRGYGHFNKGNDDFNLCYEEDDGRPSCDGTGRVPRPCPPTAQPIRRVVLTTLPQIRNSRTSRTDDDVWFLGDPSDRKVRANDIARRTHEYAGRWDSAMLAILFPGVEFELTQDGGPVAADETDPEWAATSP